MTHGHVLVASKTRNTLITIRALRIVTTGNANAATLTTGLFEQFHTE